MATADLSAKRLRELESLPGEVWKPVLGYEDRYHVSSMGRVKALSMRVNTWFGGRVRKETILKCPLSATTGYPKLALQRDRSVKHTTVHVLVLEAFVGVAPPKHETRHLNGVRHDNRLENLAWGTKLENMRDQYRHGTRAQSDRHPASKLTQHLIDEVLTSPKTGVQLAKEFGLGTATISRIRRGKKTATLLGNKPSA